MNIPSTDHTDKASLYKWANALALITIYYNIGEGLVSVFFGVADETISLFGFGFDSFVEVISGIGIWHMIRRIRERGSENLDRFERRALKITGGAFYLLTAGLVLTAMFSFYEGRAPETTFWGIVISAVSILSMWALIHYKAKVGGALGSQAILTDAACTKACMQLSVVLLLASIGYELTGIGGLDQAGALIIAGLSFREGREAFEKSRKEVLSCSCGGCHCS